MPGIRRRKINRRKINRSKFVKNKKKYILKNKNEKLFEVGRKTEK